jgi:nitrate reductase beta subunit
MMFLFRLISFCLDKSISFVFLSDSVEIYNSKDNENKDVVLLVFKGDCSGLITKIGELVGKGVFLEHDSLNVPKCEYSFMALEKTSDFPFYTFNKLIVYLFFCEFMFFVRVNI